MESRRSSKTFEVVIATAVEIAHPRNDRDVRSHSQDGLDGKFAALFTGNTVFAMGVFCPPA